MQDEFDGRLAHLLATDPEPEDADEFVERVRRGVARCRRARRFWAIGAALGLAAAVIALTPFATAFAVVVAEASFAFAVAAVRVVFLSGAAGAAFFGALGLVFLLLTFCRQILRAEL
jgi:hypothetical protein